MGSLTFSSSTGNVSWLCLFERIQLYVCYQLKLWLRSMQKMRWLCRVHILLAPVDNGQFLHLHSFIALLTHWSSKLRTSLSEAPSLDVTGPLSGWSVLLWCHLVRVDQLSAGRDASPVCPPLKTTCRSDLRINNSLLIEGTSAVVETVYFALLCAVTLSCFISYTH